MDSPVGQLLRDFSGPVSGTVVGDHNLEPLTQRSGRRADAGQRRCEMRFLIPGRNNEGNEANYPRWRGLNHIGRFDSPWLVSSLRTCALHFKPSD